MVCPITYRATITNQKLNSLHKVYSPNFSVLSKKKIHDTNETKLKKIIGYNMSSTKDFLIQA